MKIIMWYYHSRDCLIHTEFDEQSLTQKQHIVFFSSKNTLLQFLQPHCLFLACPYVNVGGKFSGKTL